ncbi:hypothetical protein ABJI51_24790 [Amycolatopsis sp. NEAU-NG30]|uniref:Uncharacterized protein n=1 Tax=Amycolatopsis melonis TaxID=3156488 RepID=A0ABV0LK85_9PSEU
MWQLYGFHADETLAVEQDLKHLTGARAGEVLGLGPEVVYDGEHRVDGEQVARLTGAEPQPGVSYYLGYRVTYLPIWETGTEPRFFWRDGKPVVAGPVRN